MIFFQIKLPFSMSKIDPDSQDVISCYECNHSHPSCVWVKTNFTTIINNNRLYFLSIIYVMHDACLTHGPLVSIQVIILKQLVV